jgi:acetoin utilization deacetylase AcuC-like enzyme
METLQDREAFPTYQLDIKSEFDRASVEAVSKVHSPDYVQFIDELSREVAARGGEPIPFSSFVPKAQQQQQTAHEPVEDAMEVGGGASPAPPLGKGAGG